MKKFLLPMLLLIAASGFLKAQITETFESGIATLNWEALDGTWSGVVNNPKPNAVNNSAKVGRYIKKDSTAYSLFWAKFTTPINLTTNNKFKISVLSKKTGTFIFKLEGPKGSKEVTKPIVVANAWQEYTLDFYSARAIDSLNRLILFFDAGVGNSKLDTFYFDNLLQLPSDACSGTVAPTTMNLLDDFECQRNASYSAGWDSLSVVDNPSKTGINTSAKVGKYNDVAGNGTEYAALIHDNVVPFDFATYPYLRVKVLAPKAGLMLLKVEGGATSKEVGTQITADQVGKWVEVTADFSSVKFGGNTKLVLFFNAGANGVVGDIYYVDDIRFTELPALEDFETTPKLTWAPLNNDAALHGTFGGAVANPAPTSTVNSSPNVGKYTKGTAVISTLTATLPANFVLATDAPQLNMMVYAPDAGKTVRLQLVSATKGNIEQTATVTAATTWEELKFDFTAAAGVTDISQMRILFDPSAAAAGKMYFFDNLKAGKLTINPCLLTVIDTTKLDDFECQRNATYAGNPPLIAIPNPKQGTTNPSDKVGQYNDPKDEYSAITIDYGTKSINLSRYNQLSVKIWSPTIVPLLFKLEGGTSPAIEKSATVTKAGDWVTYKIDFIDQKGKNHKKISIFLNAGVAHTTDDVYYIDDIEWQSEPITGCASDIESPIVFTYFANSDFDGKPVEIVTNPKKAGINLSAKVLKFDRRPGAAVFAGAFTDFGAPLKWLNNKYVIRAKVLMDHIGNFTAKVEAGPGGTGTAFEVPVANTKINEWEEITVDFTGKITGTEQYKRLTIFFDLNLPVATTSQVSYVDEFVIGNGAGCGTSGIFEAVSVEKLSVFPNPALNELTVSNTEKIKRFEITNMLGQRVKTVILSNIFDNQTISLQSLDKGLYILSGYDEKGLIAISRFVKE